MAKIKIRATVAYPIMLEIEIPEEKIQDILNLDEDSLIAWKDIIKGEADSQFEASTISPVISYCDLAVLEENMP